MRAEGRTRTQVGTAAASDKNVLFAEHAVFLSSSRDRLPDLTHLYALEKSESRLSPTYVNCSTKKYRRNSV